jgi:Ca2+-binding EF-hand superfamily protein
MDHLTAEEIAEFREIFNLVDRDGEGSISKAELADLMETLGIKATQEEIDEMIAEIDQGRLFLLIKTFVIFFLVLYGFFIFFIHCQTVMGILNLRSLLL